MILLSISMQLDWEQVFTTPQSLSIQNINNINKINEMTANVQVISIIINKLSKSLS